VTESTQLPRHQSPLPARMPVPTYRQSTGRNETENPPAFHEVHDPEHLPAFEPGLPTVLSSTCASPSQTLRARVSVIGEKHSSLPGPSREIVWRKSKRNAQDLRATENAGARA